MATTHWTLDSTHSELGFKVKHLMLSNVSGSFKEFNAEMETDENDFRTARVSLTAEMTSISTNNEQRDAHLRNSDFFETEKYPQLRFESTRVETAGEDNLTLVGTLTLKGVAKPVKLLVEFSDVTTDPWGGKRAGFTVSGKINRKDWGVNYNALLEAGGVAISEEVRIYAEIQMVQQVVSVAV